jgi:hypothetical protein
MMYASLRWFTRLRSALGACGTPNSRLAFYTQGRRSLISSPKNFCVYSDEKTNSPSVTANLAITMPRIALITGGTGLLGRAVVKSFKNAGWEVTGTGFSRASPPEIIKLNVLDEAEVSRVLDEVK